MDERALDALQQQLYARSWVHADPASHAAGVQEAVSALRSMLAASRPGVQAASRDVDEVRRPHAG